MLLLSLRLKNFKCHLNFEHEFERGVIAIYGENGSGKSSLLEAISWVLFNYLPYSDQKQIISKGKKTAEVELKILSSKDNREYLIRRKTSGQTATVYDVQAGSIFLEGVSRLQEWIKDELDLSQNIKIKSLCQNGVAVPQGNITNDFLRTPAERKEIFDSILGLDEYKSLNIKLADAYKIVDREEASLEGSTSHYSDLQLNIQTLEKEITGFEQQLSTVSSEIQSLEDSYNQNKKQYEIYCKERDEMNKAQKESERLSQEVSELTEEMESLKHSLKDKGQVLENVNQYNDYKEKRKELGLEKDKLNDAKRRQIEVSQKVLHQRKEYSSLVEEINDLNEIKNSWAESEKQLSLYKETVQSLQDKRSQYATQKANQELKETLDKQIIELKKNSQHYQSVLDEISLKKESVSQISKYEDDLVELRQKYREIKDLEDKLQLLEKNANFKSGVSVKQLQKEKESLEEQSQSLKSETDRLVAQVEVNKGLLPKLQEGGICPVFQKECLNLKESIDSVQLPDFVKTQETEYLDIIKKNTGILEGNAQSLITLNQSLELTSEYEAMKNEIGSHSSQDIENDGQKLKIKLQSLKKDQVLVDQKSNFQKNLDIAQEQIKELRTKVESISSSDNLEVLYSDLNTLEKQVNDMIPAIDQITINQNKLETLEDKENLKTTIQKEVQICEELQEQIVQEIESLGAVAEELDKVEQKIEELEPFSQQLSIIQENEKRLLDCDSKLAKKNIEWEQYKKDIENIVVQPDAWFVEEERKLQSQSEEINNKKGLKHGLEFSFTDKSRLLSDYKKQEDIFKGQLDRLKNIADQKFQLKKLREYFKEASVKVSQFYTQQISRIASHIFNETMEDSAFELVWNESYGIQAFKHGQELNFEVLSGGQQIMAALAIRLGLLQELSNISFAFFDEPTAHLDRDRRNQLAIQLSSIQSFKQLFVITHDESFAGQANHVIHL